MNINLTFNKMIRRDLNYNEPDETTEEEEVDVTPNGPRV